MTILLHRRLNGHPMLVNPGSGSAQGGVAGYTLSQTSAGSMLGAGASYLAIVPSAGTWPAGTISLNISGIAAAVANVTGAVIAWRTLTPKAGATSINLVVVPLEVGVLSVATTNTMGLTDPSALSYISTPPNASPPALSDLVAVQLFPLDPNVPDFARACWVLPIGGCGPFTFVTPNANTENYITRDVNGSPQGSNSSGVITLYAAPPKPAGPTVQVTDARGAVMTKQFPIQVSAASPVFSIGGPNPQTNAAIAYHFEPGSSASLTYTITKQDGTATTDYYFDGGGFISSHSQPLPAGSYPLTMHGVESGGAAHTLNMTFQVCAYTQTAHIDFVQGTVSTSMLAGSYVGYAAANTPNNTPTFSLTDASNTFQINAATGTITCANQPASAGAHSISITVTDGPSSYTQTFSVSVQTGTTLASSNMSFAACTTAFNNDTYSNTIGTPTVTGVTGTKQWSLVSQSSYNAYAVANSTPARYQIDKNTGAITAPLILSAELDGTSAATDALFISCTDGINTCSSTLNITVNWASITTTYYVGRGMSTAHPGTGFETFAQARALSMARHSGTIHVLVYADTDPDYYTNDNGNRTSDFSLRFPWQGPIIIEGVAANGKTMPRLGGPANNQSAGGSDTRGKGFIVIGDGDGVIKNLELSGCHDAYSDGYHGNEAIRKDGQTAGNLSVLNCYIHDNDNGVLSGIGHQRILVDSCLIENSGTSHVSSGACHGMYLGDASEIIVRNTVGRHSSNGHILKTRAQKATVHDCRVFDGIGGSASACLEFPNAGQVEVYNVTIEKGTMAFGPDAIRYGAEGYIWSTNSLYVHNNTISVLTPDGNHFAPSSAVGFFYGANTFGVAGSLTLAMNSIYLATGANKINFYGTSNMTPSETATTMLSSPAAISQTRPDQSGSFPTVGFLFRMQVADSYNNINGVQQLADRERITMASSTATGTTIANLRASNDTGAIGAGTPNPFAAGTSWSIITDAIPPYGTSAPWAPTGRYSITSNSDGTAALKVAGALSAGVDNVQLRATAPGGMVVDFRYAVVVS